MGRNKCMCTSWEGVFLTDVDVPVGQGSVTLSHTPLPLPLPRMMESSLFYVTTVYEVTFMNTHTHAVAVVAIGILLDPSSSLFSVSSLSCSLSEIQSNRKSLFLFYWLIMWQFRLQGRSLYHLGSLCYLKI